MVNFIGVGGFSHYTVATVLAIEITDGNISLRKFTVGSSVSVVAQAHGNVARLIIWVALSIDAKISVAIAIADRLMLTELSNERVLVVVRSAAAVAKILFVVVVVPQPQHTFAVVLARRCIVAGMELLGASGSRPSWLAGTAKVVHNLFLLKGRSSEDTYSTILALLFAWTLCRCGRLLGAGNRQTSQAEQDRQSLETRHGWRIALISLIFNDEIRFKEGYGTSYRLVLSPSWNRLASGVLMRKKKLCSP